MLRKDGKVKKNWLKWQKESSEHNRKMQQEDPKYIENYNNPDKGFKIKNGKEYYDGDILEDGKIMLCVIYKEKEWSHCVKKIYEIIKKEYELKHNKGGRKPKMSINEMVEATFDYIYDNEEEDQFIEVPGVYVCVKIDGEKVNVPKKLKKTPETTYQTLASKYIVSKRNICDTINWIKNTLIEKNILFIEDEKYHFLNYKKLNIKFK